MPGAESSRNEIQSLIFKILTVSCMFCTNEILCTLLFLKYHISVNLHSENYQFPVLVTVKSNHSQKELFIRQMCLAIQLYFLQRVTSMPHNIPARQMQGYAKNFQRNLWYMYMRKCDKIPISGKS